VISVDRDWFIHPDSFRAPARLVVDEAVGVPSRASAQARNVRRGAPQPRRRADERVFAFLLSSLGAEGVVATERDKGAARLPRRAPVAGAAARGRRGWRRSSAGRKRPRRSAADALGRPASRGDEEHELFQVLVQSGKLVRVKDSLFFHARALDSIQTKLVTFLRERQGDRPRATSRTCSVFPGNTPFRSSNSSIQRRVTARVGGKRILRRGWGRVRYEVAGKEFPMFGLGYRNC